MLLRMLDTEFWTGEVLTDGPTLWRASMRSVQRIKTKAGYSTLFNQIKYGAGGGGGTSHDDEDSGKGFVALCHRV
jgi:hypothetical protein